MKVRNRRAPITVASGTPMVIISIADFLPSTTVFCFGLLDSYLGHSKCFQYLRMCIFPNVFANRIS